jgi:hypothetical protein
LMDEGVVVWFRGRAGQGVDPEGDALIQEVHSI